MYLNNLTFTTKIFVNLPVKDLKRSIDFFTRLGFTFNPKFTDENATCMIVGENIFAMLLTEKRFKDFTKKEISDATKTTEVLIAIDVESREKVVELISAAKEAGGTVYMDAADHGWMYQHSFADPDGHQWELLFIDESKMPKDIHSKEATAENKTSITIETKVNAPIEKIWDYWTKPEHIINWNNASDDWHTPKAENDLTEGGKFNYHMAAKDGSFEFDFGGTYTIIINQKRIEYELGDGRKVKIDFIKEDNIVKIVETFEAESTNSIELQRTGWQAILDNFRNYTES